MAISGTDLLEVLTLYKAFVEAYVRDDPNVFCHSLCDLWLIWNQNKDLGETGNGESEK